MIDSVGSSTNASSSSRTQAVSQTQSLRNNPAVLNAIVQTQQRASGATAPAPAFAVPQTTRTGASANVKLPRGSLVDVIA